MAGKKPFFITGSNCKIKVNGVTLAYATDLSYTVTINHAPVKVLGVYESDTIEPLSYSVSGSFTLIRYIDSAIDSLGYVNGANGYGNGVGSFAQPYQFTRPDLLRTDGKADQSANPAKLGDATGFDIEMYQKVPNNSLGIAKIRNCRIVAINSQISKRSPMIQQFQFVANYLDEDSYIAETSGQGQQFS